MPPSPFLVPPDARSLFSLNPSRTVSGESSSRGCMSPWRLILSQNSWRAALSGPPWHLKVIGRLPQSRQGPGDFKENLRNLFL
jgi:hypothetical protein